MQTVEDRRRTLGNDFVDLSPWPDARQSRKVPVEGLRLQAIDARLTVAMLDQAADAASALNVAPLNALVVVPGQTKQSTPKFRGIGRTVVNE